MPSSITKTIRPFLNAIRAINKLPFLERRLAKRTNGKKYPNFWVRLLPSLESYPKGSFRQVTRDGIRYRVDISDYMEYVIYFGLDDEPKRSLYESVIEGMYIFDIGTNIGETLLNFARLNRTGKNFGFEPVPFLYKKAEANIALNSFSNIVLNNLAVSDKKGVLFFDLPNNQNNGSISMHHQATENSKEVKAVTLDAYVREKNIQKVDLIKVDVEGFEAHVINGAINTIQQYWPVLFMEINNNYLKRSGSSAGELLKLVDGLGYVIMDAETLEQINVHAPLKKNHFDVLCKRIEG